MAGNVVYVTKITAGNSKDKFDSFQLQVWSPMTNLQMSQSNTFYFLPEGF